MNRLQNDDEAIDFVATDYLGNEINLSAYKGKKILLSFFRVASCPFCNVRIHELILKKEEFEKRNIQIIAFFASPQEEINKYAGKQAPPFPVIPDPQMKLYWDYGVEQSLAAMFKVMVKPAKMMKVMVSGFFNLKSIKEKPVVPADFLLNEEHKIDQAYYGKDFGDHIPIPEILKWGEKS